MDINGIDNLYKAKLSSSHKIDKNNGFRQIFDGKIAKLNPTTISTPVDSKADVLERGDKILNLLDDYAIGLNDPAKTLKDIGPLVKSIEKEMSLIEAEAADKFHNDKELEKLIENLAVTANVAVLKFRRGDYI